MPLDLATLRSEVSTIETRLNKSIAALHVTSAERDELTTDIETVFTNGLNTLPDKLLQMDSNGLDVVRADLDGVLAQVNRQAIIADL